ncbi:MAG: HAD family hydrolase [Nocardioides sp.]|nr:HAD family hydrolase [Nocardioides sp.]
MRAVIFDLDDTLVDQSSAARTAAIAWGRDRGAAGEDDDLARRWSEISNPHYARYQQRLATFEEQRRARVREFLPHLDLRDDAVADREFDAYLDLYVPAWACFPDSVRTLRRVRAAGLLATVLTNGDHEHQTLKLELVGLSNEVDALFTSDQFPLGKPDRRPFLGSCARLGVAPSEAVMVGDSVTDDVEGAIAAGLAGVLLDRRDRHPDTEHTRIRSLDDLDVCAGARLET